MILQLNESTAFRSWPSKNHSGLIHHDCISSWDGRGDPGVSSSRSSSYVIWASPIELHFEYRAAGLAKTFSLSIEKINALLRLAVLTKTHSELVDFVVLRVASPTAQLRTPYTLPGNLFHNEGYRNNTVR